MKYTTEQRLIIYSQALVDWNKPIEQCKHNNTDFGFCEYFKIEKKIEVTQNFKEILPELYSQRTSDHSMAYHYKGSGADNHGRLSRIDALRKAINEVSNKIFFKASLEL